MAIGDDNGSETEASWTGRRRAVWILSAAVFLLVFSTAAFGLFILIRYDGDRIRSQIVSAIAEATGRKASIEGGVHLDFALRPSLSVRGIRVANADWASADAMVSVEEAEIAFGLVSLLIGRPAAAEVRLSGVVLRLESDEEGNRNWKPVVKSWRGREEKGESPARPFGLLSAIAVRDGTVVHRRVPDGALRRVHVRNAALVAEEGEDGIDLEAEGTFGDQAFSVEGEWGSLAALTEPAAPFLFDVAFSLPPTEGALRGSFRRSGGLPGISAELTAETVDLKPLFSGTGRGGPTGGGNGTPPEVLFSPDPWPLEMLGSFVAEVQGEVARVLLPGTTVSRLRFDLRVEEGELRVDPLEADAGEGALSASLRIDGRPVDSRVHLRLQLQESRLSELAGGSWDEPPAGRLDTDLRVEGKGNSAADLAATVDGHLAVVFRDGRLRNRHFEWFGKDAAEVFYRLFHPGHEQQDAAQVHCGIARIDFEKGEAGAKALVVDTEATTVIGDGGVNLEEESWDLTVRRKVKEGVPGLNMDVTEWTQSFRIAGPLSRPSVFLDPAEAAWSLAKALGGMALFGPAGAAAALLDPSELAGEDPCSRALKGISTANGSTAEAGKRDKDDGSEE